MAHLLPQAGVTSATFTLNAGNAGSYTIDAIYNGGLGTTVLVIGSANPAPTLTSISPATGQKGGAAFTLTLNGTSFVSGAVAKWNGTALTTTFVSATKLTAAVPAADLLSAGSQTVTVTNPDTQVSGSQSFTVINPLPTITTISPTSATAGAAAFTLTVNGTNFLAGAVVQWNGATLPTTFISAAQLTAAVPATDVASQGERDYHSRRSRRARIRFGDVHNLCCRGRTNHYNHFAHLGNGRCCGLHFNRERDTLPSDLGC